MSESGSSRRYHPPGRLTVQELVDATSGRLVREPSGHDLGSSWTLCTDTRELDTAAVFVALRGEVHDGHRFVNQALATGVVGALIDERSLAEGLVLPDKTAGPVIAVPDTLVAFGDASRALLENVGPVVAAVTGSVGKTTTRSMLASILRQASPGLESEGNFNNRIGVPLTVLRLDAHDRWAVLEMGMSEPGEIRELARFTEPRVRVITEVTAAHLEFFSGVEEIADAKGELFESALPGNTLIYPADNPLSARFPKPPGARLVPFSMEPHSGAPARVLSIDDRGPDGSDATLLLPAGTIDVHVPLPGVHQVHNALAAAAAATAMGASLDDVAAGLESVQVPGRRMKISRVGGATVLDDAYNANPASVEAGLRTLAAFPTSLPNGRRVAAIGDMLELGPTGPALHAEVGRLAASLGIELLVATGPLMRSAAKAIGAGTLDTRSVAVDDADAAGKLLAGWLREGDVLLLKGSRGMRMEGVLEHLEHVGKD
ncbi:MAG: UDP-N-acetylmuramoyl-tripeptide--D-alanyl-D-alanine ligase [Deltaproteobacteria bacterium]|nr:UDP-N-acetylmuramoyl-tripeptide--D-alanyl-D-alanine ligase [Deltaproteobacteria bacterium]